MSDIKALPDNLEELEKDTEFKKTYKKYTADELELKLIESNVEFLTIDNKSALVWRLLDSQGYTFGATGTNNAETQDVTEPTNTATSDATSDANGPTSDDAGADGSFNGDNSAVTLDEPVSEPMGEPTNNAEQGDTDAANDLPSTPSVETIHNSDDADNSDDLPASVEAEGEPTVEPAVDTAVETEPVTEPVTEPTYEPTYEPTVEADIAIEALDEPLYEPVIEAEPTIEVEPEPQPVVVIADYVDVENTGDFNMLEPATSTLIVAGTTTRVRIKGYATKDQVLRNIEQYNYNRGNKLAVISF